MDRALTDAQGGTPPPAPLAMPTQRLDVAPPWRFRAPAFRVRIARLIAFGGAVAIAYAGHEQMRLVFGNETRTFLQDMLLWLFTVTFGWISLSATQTVAGLLAGPRPPKDVEDAPPVGRTVLLMPVYHEDPSMTAAALFAMGDALAEAGHGDAFEIFVVSDSRDAAAWAKETAAMALLREKLKGRMAVWHRRRRRNTARKAGNLHDFVERWGGRYDYMLVLDADSLMSAETILALVRRMDRAPDLGILQTTPILAGGKTLFARLQQFAGRLYGPVIARGVAAWQGLDGNYWGHNALIRMKAFAEACGLPELKGRKPFGGHIMSHDFVEAALIRRAGWDVRMDPDLEGSWEGSPPSLLDLAQRDRRWAQGNLQHANVMGGRGFRASNRAHFVIGIGAYLMSPIWLAMLLVGLMLTAQILISEPEYFPEAAQLFPNWPVFDAERMRMLFFAAMTLLLLPKAVGLGRALFLPGLRRRFGGPARILAGGLAEIALSALYAPVQMLMQTRQVFEILTGRDSGWGAQTREGGAIGLRQAIRRHWRHTVAAFGPAIALYYMAPEQLVWVAPVLAGLLLAPLLSWASGQARLGWTLAALGLLSIPEERKAPDVWRRARRVRHDFRKATAIGLDGFLRDPAVVARHVSMLSPEPGESEADRLLAITARAKIEAAPTPARALAWLTPDETAAVLADPALLRLWTDAAARRLAAQ